jgi:hypothetical protein
MSIATSGFGTLFQSGAGGASTLPAGGELEGSYDGSVICEGDLDLTDDTTVKGDLIVNGTLSSTGGHTLTVTGDLIAHSIQFENDEGQVGNITVHGDLYFAGQFRYRQSGESPATLWIGGNFIGREDIEEENDSSFNGSGIGGVSGARVRVFGGATMDSFYVNGGDNEDGNGGNGGSVIIRGSLTIYDEYEGHGGSGLNGNGGDGGSLSVDGNINAGTANVDLHGGDATNGNGGRGGDLSVENQVVLNELNINGGDCYSDTYEHYAGAGGEADIDGNFVSNDYVTLSGGTRYGTVEGEIGDSTYSSGGSLWVGGNCVVDDLDIEGGDVEISGLCIQRAGNGGSFNCDGDVTVGDDIRMDGGYSSGGHGGDGGSLYIGGNLVCDSTLSVRGGDSNDSGDGGDGGGIDVIGSASCYTVYGQGGGSQNTGSGGNGGSIEVDGVFTFDETCEFYGGSCNSVDASKRAGSGGSVRCRAIFADEGYVEVYGGSRSGSTSASSPGGESANGGYVNVYGDAAIYRIEANGGDVFTSFPGLAGGAGGSISVQGTLTCEDALEVYGGQGCGSNGGNGGYIDISGMLRANRIEAGGGGANDSEQGSDAGTNGRAANVYLYGGCVVNYFYARDGVGPGSAASGETVIQFAGSVTINDLDVSDRSDAYIRAGAVPVIMKVQNLPTKTTFNNSGGAATVALDSYCGNSIFFTDVNSGWYYVQGTSLAD